MILHETLTPADAPVELYDVSGRLCELVKEIKDLRKRLASPRVTEQGLPGPPGGEWVGVHRQIANVSSLYAAALRLHEARGRQEVLAVISDVLVNVAGADQFGVFEIAPGAGVLSLIGSRGIEPSRYHRLPAEAGTETGAEAELIGEVIRTGQTWRAGTAGASNAASNTASGTENLLACFALKVPDRVLGAVALFGLLAHKPGLEPFDGELFDLLGVHAGRALLSSGPSLAGGEAPDA